MNLNKYAKKSLTRAAPQIPRHSGASGGSALGGPRESKRKENAPAPPMSLGWLKGFRVKGFWV